MTNLSSTIIAKSDQLNSDDLLGGPITVHVSKVSLLAGDQPISIHYEGDNGKPWKPCKTMRRVLVGLWGSQGSDYVGRWLTLYRDPTVKFGGDEVGGIRISHMSHIDKEMSLSLTATRGKKKPFTVRPLTNIPTTPPKIPPAAPVGAVAAGIEEYKKAGHVAAKKGTAALKKWWSGIGGNMQNQLGAPFLEMLKPIAKDADAAPSANQQLPAPEDSDMPPPNEDDYR